MLLVDPAREVARLARALSKTNTGARCMLSPTTVQVTPPERLSTFMPRL